MMQNGRESTCPCQTFRSVENVVDALESSERTRLLIAWLSGESENYCGTYSCNNRVEISLAILNAVRDACRIFLEDTQKKQPTTYEESFPALSLNSKSKNASAVTKKNLQGGNKRRIRPATLAPASNATAWGASKGNLVGLASEEPLNMPTQKHFTKAFVESTKSLRDLSLPRTNAFLTPEKSGAPRWKGERPSQPLFTPDKNEDFSKAISLKHLIDVYATLIDSCLVPSTPLELHLLFRLLFLPNETKNGVSPTSPLGSILLDNPSCIHFARESLQRQAKVFHGLGPVMWKTLVGCTPFRDLMPAVYDECDHLLKEYDGNNIPPASVTNNQTALLTLPFDEERDSRHNFRSPQDQAIYMNRESTRDSFLYQLRSFLSMRGKVLDATQVDKAIQSIRRSSRSVIEDLMETNFTWFSNFFCDILLQIGLVPLQETDKELLEIADKDKLQKLHQRFSKSTSQSRSSSHKVAADPARSSNSPRSEALHLFPGHQEFFFIFILSADSYAFTIHLRRAIINKMINTMKISEDEFSERKLMEMCMLARYVGLLFFSPNWRSFGATKEYLSTDPALDAVLQLKSCGLCIMSALESSVSDNKLHLTVPWVVELLQLSSWDLSALKSKSYLEVLSTLRQLQTGITNQATDLIGRQIISLSVESFFGNAIGVAVASKLPPRALPEIVTEWKRIDTVGVFSSTALFSCIAYLEDLNSLISMISRKKTGSTKSPGVSRKLRPSVLSHVPSPSPQKIKGFDQDRKPEDTMKSKLRDGFFHRYPEMKVICEFVVPRILRKLRVDELEMKIELEMKSRSKTLAGTGSAEVQESVLVECCDAMIRTWLEEHIQKSLELLSPVQLDHRVLSVAASLGVEYGIELSGSISEQIAASQKALWMNSAADEAKELFPVEQKSPNRSRSLAELIERCIDSVDRLSGVLSDALTLDHTAPELENANKALRILSEKSGTDIPSEDDLRKLFTAIFKLDKFSTNILDLALTGKEPSENRWLFISAYLSFAEEIQRWSHFGLDVLKRRCNEVNTLCTIVSLGVSASSPTHLAEFSARMTKARVWKSASVEASLRKLCNEGYEGASHILAAYQNIRTDM